MADLAKEYTDIKNIKHKVEHVTSKNAKDNKEQIIKEICGILINKRKDNVI